jgi:hypothetical protein
MQNDVAVKPAVYHDLEWQERREIRNQYVQSQGGLCMHCNQPLDGPPPEDITAKPIKWSLFPPNFLKYPVHLQHDHRTGLTEGAVHSYCNAVLWQYEGR